MNPFIVYDRVPGAAAKHADAFLPEGVPSVAAERLQPCPPVNALPVHDSLHN